MKTRFTELLGVDYPIMNAGMNAIALPRMVAAVNEAGGLGVLGAGAAPPDATRRMINEVRQLTDKPFGINCPLAVPNGKENAQLALEEKVPVINYSMGGGRWIVSAAHEYGGKVIASVNSEELAVKAQQQGADAVIAAGHEAGGHGGEVSTFVLVQRLVDLLDVPVIAAGGIASGRGLLGALALGASGVSMGTRFWVTQEGPVHSNWKQRAVELGTGGTLHSTRFDGEPNRQMDSEMARKLISRPLNYFRALADSPQIAKTFGLPYFPTLLNILKSGPKAADTMARMATMLTAQEIAQTSGEIDKGIMGAGQSVGLVHDVPSIADVIRRIIQELEASQMELDKKLNS